MCVCVRVRGTLYQKLTIPKNKWKNGKTIIRRMMMRLCGIRQRGIDKDINEVFSDGSHFVIYAQTHIHTHTVIFLRIRFDNNNNWIYPSCAIIYISYNCETLIKFVSVAGSNDDNDNKLMNRQSVRAASLIQTILLCDGFCLI